MNIQESKDFNFVHQYNMNTLNMFINALQYFWIKAGRPQSKDSPEYKNSDLKHAVIIISGAMDRSLAALRDNK